MKAMINMICRECVYWHSDGAGHGESGECRRSPPRIIEKALQVAKEGDGSGRDPGSIIDIWTHEASVWPVTFDDSWCGEWAQKGAESRAERGRPKGAQNKRKLGASSPMAQQGAERGIAPMAYGPSEAAKAAGVSRTEIYERMKAGDLPARKLGRRTLILAADLQAYLAGLPAHEKQPAPALDVERVIANLIRDTSEPPRKS